MIFGSSVIGDQKGNISNSRRPRRKNAIIAGGGGQDYSIFKGGGLEVFWGVSTTAIQIWDKPEHFQLHINI